MLEEAGGNIKSLSWEGGNDWSRVLGLAAILGWLCEMVTFLSENRGLYIFWQYLTTELQVWNG